jgi:glycosyltransferase involved in cell wall biosynthesis
MVAAGIGRMASKRIFMRIIYLHQYFRTPEQGGAIRSYHLAKALVQAGHEVDMITAHNHASYRYEEIEGIRVHYLPVYYENNLGFAGRLFSFIRFMYLAYRRASTVAPADLCYATSTPLTIGLVALWLKRFRKIPFYFEVRDLWPEAPIQMGVIRNSFLKKYLYALEQKIYRHAEKIIALSPGIEQGIRKSIGANTKTVLIPNFSDCSFFFPEDKQALLEQKFEVKNKFVISYTGTLGQANHLEYLLHCAQLLHDQKETRVHIIIAGKGAQEDALKDKYKHLPNVSFIGFLNKNGIMELMNISDAVYISYASLPILQTNSPNKFFDGLAAGKLCISNTAGWLQELIEQHDCGFYYPSEQPAVFVQKLLPYIEDTSLLKDAQLRARALAEQQFSKTIMTQRFLSLFSKK